MDIKHDIRQMARAAGAWACGFAQAGPVDEEYWSAYQQWIAEGRCGTMDYCSRYADVRRDPRLLLSQPDQPPCERAVVISCAFPYNTPRRNPIIASYALGYDYHYVLSQRLSAVADEICARYGGRARVVVDSAPILEKYWAVRAGIGFQGRNGLVIIPGVGSYVFLAEIIWACDSDIDIDHDIDPRVGTLGWDMPPLQGYTFDSLLLTFDLQPTSVGCSGCDRCQRACPGQAIRGDGTIDARRCVSYLTIEHRGELPPDAKLGGSVYGCDRCQMACPHNANVPVSDIPEFAPRPEILALDAAAIAALTPSQYRRLVARSAMRRVPLARLKRACDSQLLR